MIEARTPPHSLEAEQSVLGGLLLDASAMDRIGDILTESDFYRGDHRQIFRAIVKLLERQQPADMLTVNEALKGERDPVSLVYLGELMQATPTAHNIRRYAEIVREHAVKRKLLEVGAAIMDSAMQPGSRPVAELVDEAESRVMAITESRADRQGLIDLHPLLSEAVERIDMMFHREDKSGLTGIATGFTDLDVETSGFQEGDLIVLAARPSQGKTALALNIAEHVAVVLRLPVAVFSMEMSGAQLATRLLGSSGRLNQHAVRSGRLNDDDWGRLTNAVGKLSDAPILIDESPALTSMELRSKCRRMLRQFGKVGLVVVDYLQLMSASGRGETRANDVAEISRSMKALAKELNCPVVALSQLNRSLEQRPNKRPVMSDLRECLPVEEWVDTPTGPVRLKSRPAQIVSADGCGAVQADCSFIEKRYNSTYRVVTPFGSFSATARHQVLTGTGWKAVRDIVPGRDVIACPKRIPHANRGPLPHGRLLGWLLGNGGLSGTPALIYRKELHQDVTEAVVPFGVSVRLRSAQKSDNVYDAYLSNGKESGCLPNPLMTWIRALGLEGLTALDKEIPALYLGSSDETHTALLRGLWESDGTVTGGNAKYTTASETMARQVKWLLHTIGVRSTLNRYENGHAGLWEVRCAMEDNERMRPVCSHPGRFGELSMPSPRYIDRAPAIFVELASEIYRGKETFQRRRDGAVKQIPKARMQAVLAECPISTIAESPYMTMQGMGWATVYAIEPDETEVRVCDLNVPSTHCFLTNGLVVHNSGAIEQDADLILFIYRDEVYNPNTEDKGRAEIIIGKQRNGPTGMVKLTFLGQYTRFENYAKEGY